MIDFNDSHEKVEYDVFDIVRIIMPDTLCLTLIIPDVWIIDQGILEGIR